MATPKHSLDIGRVVTEDQFDYDKLLHDITPTTEDIYNSIIRVSTEYPADIIATEEQVNNLTLPVDQVPTKGSKNRVSANNTATFFYGQRATTSKNVDLVADTILHVADINTAPANASNTYRCVAQNLNVGFDFTALDTSSLYNLSQFHAVVTAASQNNLHNQATVSIIPGDHDFLHSSSTSITATTVHVNATLVDSHWHINLSTRSDTFSLSNVDNSATIKFIFNHNINGYRADDDITFVSTAQDSVITDVSKPHTFEVPPSWRHIYGLAPITHYVLLDSNGQKTSTTFPVVNNSVTIPAETFVHGTAPTLAPVYQAGWYIVGGKRWRWPAAGSPTYSTTNAQKNETLTAETIQSLVATNNIPYIFDGSPFVVWARWSEGSDNHASKVSGGRDTTHFKLCVKGQPDQIVISGADPNSDDPQEGKVTTGYYPTLSGSTPTTGVQVYSGADLSFHFKKGNGYWLRNVFLQISHIYIQG